MAGTVVTGARGTGDVNANQRKIDMRAAVLQLEPDMQALNVISNRLGSAATHNPKYTWWEDEPFARFDAVNGTTGTGTSVVVDTPTMFSNLDLVKVTRTAEVMRVTAINVGTSTLTVVRGVGGSAVALVDNDELFVIGAASPENDTSRVARTQNPVEVTNYTSIQRDSIEESGTAMSSAYNTSPTDWDYISAQVGKEHSKQLELKLWHGKPSENLTGGANGKPLRTTGGALHFISTNITAAGGTLTEATWRGAQRAAFRYGSGQKVAFCAGIPLGALNSFPMSKLQVIQPAEGTIAYGLKVNRMIGPFGDCLVVYNKLFEGAVYGGIIATLDMNNIRRRFLSSDPGGSRDTHILTNRQPNDQDGRKDEWLTEAGLEFGIERTHSLITGITGPA
jgi:hypothetical protein